MDSNCFSTKIIYARGNMSTSTGTNIKKIWIKDDIDIMLHFAGEINKKSWSGVSVNASREYVDIRDEKDVNVV